jgi:hypothetical protein
MIICVEIQYHVWFFPRPYLLDGSVVITILDSPLHFF